MEQCYFSFMLFGRYFQLTKAKVFQILADKDGWRTVFKINRIQLNVISIIIGLFLAVLFAVFYEFIFIRWILGPSSFILLSISGYYFDKLSVES